MRERLVVVVMIADRLDVVQAKDRLLSSREGELVENVLWIFACANAINKRCVPATAITGPLGAVIGGDEERGRAGPSRTRAGPESLIDWRATFADHQARTYFRAMDRARLTFVQGQARYRQRRFPLPLADRTDDRLQPSGRALPLRSGPFAPDPELKTVP